MPNAAPSSPPSPAAFAPEAARALRAVASHLSAPGVRPFSTAAQVRRALRAEGVRSTSLWLAWRSLREACTGSTDAHPSNARRFSQWWRGGAGLPRQLAVLERAAERVQVDLPSHLPSVFALLPLPLASSGLGRYLDLLTFPVEDNATWCAWHHLLGPVATHAQASEEALRVRGHVGWWLWHELLASLFLLRIPLRGAFWRLTYRCAAGSAEERASIWRQFLAVRESLRWAE